MFSAGLLDCSLPYTSDICSIWHSFSTVHSTAGSCALDFVCMGALLSCLIAYAPKKSPLLVHEFLNPSFCRSNALKSLKMVHRCHCVHKLVMNGPKLEGPSCGKQMLVVITVSLPSTISPSPSSWYQKSINLWRCSTSRSPRHIFETLVTLTDSSTGWFVYSGPSSQIGQGVPSVLGSICF